MNEKTTIEEQKKRLKQILRHLKEIGISQKEIAAKTDTDAIYLSHLKGKSIIYIPTEFLEKLHTVYNINPDYVRGNSDFMFDLTGTKLDNFEKFVDNWDTVTRQDNHYLHLSMDENFYNFLLEVNKARLVAEEGISSLDEEIAQLKQLYDGQPNIQEYVLIPKNNFIGIISESVAQEKQLSEVLNLMEYADYNDNVSE